MQPFRRQSQRHRDTRQQILTLAANANLYGVRAALTPTHLVVAACERRLIPIDIRSPSSNKRLTCAANVFSRRAAKRTRVDGADGRVCEGIWWAAAWCTS